VRGVGDYRNLEVCDVYLEQRPTVCKCVHPRLSRSSLPLPLNPRRFFRLWSSIVLQVTHLISPCVTSALLPLTSTMQHLVFLSKQVSFEGLRRIRKLRTLTFSYSDPVDQQRPVLAVHPVSALVSLLLSCYPVSEPSPSLQPQSPCPTMLRFSLPCFSPDL
jgi:hypothetical protein